MLLFIRSAIACHPDAVKLEYVGSLSAVWGASANELLPQRSEDVLVQHFIDLPQLAGM